MMTTRALRMRGVLLTAGLASLLVVACGQTQSDTGADSGLADSTTAFDTFVGTDASDATMGNDVQSIFGDDSGDDVSTGDDAPVGDDAGEDAGGDGSSGDGASGHDGAAGKDGGGTDGAIVTDGGGSKDTGPAIDAGCVAVTVPTSTSTETCTFVSGTCGPGTLSGFSPSAPTPVKASVCATNEIQNYYNGCLSPTSSDATCMAANVSAPCYGCLVTPQSKGAWGPLVATTDGLVQINVGGCLDLTEPCNHACAVALNDDLQCEQQSCATNCPTSTSAEQTAFNGCVSTVDSCSNGCWQYFVGTECASQITGPGATCTQPVGNDAQFEAAFLAIAPLFCGM